MSGNAPQVTVTLNPAGPYRPGDQITATAQIVDADTYTQNLTGVDDLGASFTEVISHVDPEQITWSWQSSGMIASGLNPLVEPAPDASDTLVCTVVDGQGNTTQATADVEVQPAMLIGSDYKPISPTRYRNLRYVRMFDGANLPDLTAVPAGTVAHPSVAALPSDDALNAYWTKWAAPGRPVLYFTYKHEVNTGKKGTAAQFQADMRHIIALRNAHPYRDRIKIVVIFGLYQQVHNVAGDWTVWFGALPVTKPATANAAAVTGVDAIGADCYIMAGTATFPAPAPFFAPMLAIAKTLGLPIIICELGLTPPVAGETYGPKTAAWFKACCDYLAGLAAPSPCLAVAAWDNPATSPTQVLAGAALSTWQQIVATQ